MSTTVPTDRQDRRPEARPPEPGRTRQAGAALATFGLLLAAAGPVLVIAADPGATPFVLPFLLIPAVGAALAWFFGTWSKVVAVLLGLVLLASTAGGPAGEGLRYPGSFFDFVPGVLFALGGLTALVGGVLAIAARRQARPWIAGRERGAATAVLGVAGALAVVSAGVTVGSGAALTAAELAGADAVVTMVDSAFAPADLDLPAGTATIALVNDGRFVHTFTSDVLGVDETVVPGDSVLVQVDVPAQAGPIVFYCTPHSGEGGDGERVGMVGELQAAG